MASLECCRWCSHDKLGRHSRPALSSLTAAVQEHHCIATTMRINNNHRQNGQYHSISSQIITRHMKYMMGIALS